MTSNEISIFRVFSILDEMVGETVDGDITNIVAERLVDKTEQQAGPTTVKDWTRIELAFVETSWDQKSSFARSAYDRAARISRKRAEAIAFPSC